MTSHFDLALTPPHLHTPAPHSYPRHDGAPCHAYRPTAYRHTALPHDPLSAGHTHGTEASRCSCISEGGSACAARSGVTRASVCRGKLKLR